MTRAEWIAASAILLNLATLIFGGGAFYQTVQDHEGRLGKVEERTDALIPRVERIDTNVGLLLEQAREQRMKDGGK